MNERDEMAQAVFVADNWRELPENALKDWGALVSVQGDDTYAHHIASGLIAAGYRKQEP